MVADCLTKLMREDFLMQVLNSNVWNFKQTEEAKAIKHRKSAQRRAKKQDSDPEPPSGHDAVPARADEQDIDPMPDSWSDQDD